MVKTKGKIERGRGERRLMSACSGNIQGVFPSVPGWDAGIRGVVTVLRRLVL
jgi:hypothetical protein